MNYTATTSHYRNSRDKTQRRTDEEQELTSAMSTDLQHRSREQAGRGSERGRGLRRRERAEDLCDGGAAEMTGGGRNQSLGLRRRASEWRGSDGRDRPRGELDAWERDGFFCSYTPWAILEFKLGPCDAFVWTNEGLNTNSKHFYFQVDN